MPALTRSFMLLSLLVLVILAGAAAAVVPPVPPVAPAPSIPKDESPVQAPRYTGPSRFA